MLYLKIPKERIPIAIGKGGEVKAYIEKAGGMRVDIDSENGDVTIYNDEAEQSYYGLKVRDVIKALARGFSPENAYRLFNDDYYLSLIDMHDFVSKKPSHTRRMKARIIGRNGKTRELLEEYTDCTVSIYGDTVAIIGDVVGLSAAKEAVEMILSGSEHKSVYRFLERKRQGIKMSRMGIDYVERR